MGNFVKWLAVLLFGVTFANAQSSVKRYNISRIRSVQQVVQLLCNIDSHYRQVKIPSALTFMDSDCQRIADSLKLTPWSKADLDNDGRTDLLIIINQPEHTILCVLDKGGHYELKTLNRDIGSQSCSFPVIAHRGKTAYIKYIRQPDRGTLEVITHFSPINIIFKYGDFIEENPKPAAYAIQKIEYATSGAFITVGETRLVIDARCSALLNDHSSGTLRPEEFAELGSLLNYIKFEDLYEEYRAQASDQTTAIITITYDNGKTKTITDYGMTGTLGLNLLYQKLEALKRSIQWKEHFSPPGPRLVPVSVLP
ncbi:DUF6438 domain-containing protein [Niabella drilacis]|uniref:DUF6438 domain-containing protein n=1 Tax=Niabella drilacis (strain DSM 25811 / CCM 8410 / CCUG 62505 / LMG 26954 / E90) TaxID=1285928 RepID=A0A1G6YQW9_NIADE|nr:hypothetical protein [Niabella drilacis]SDD92433.1 hypothetical protein SAMN04487894_11655 [Niabella drilacis]